MDWQAVLTVIVVGILFLIMMRGCGGMGGACGMGLRRRNERTNEGKMEHPDQPDRRHDGV